MSVITFRYFHRLYAKNPYINTSQAPLTSLDPFSSETESRTVDLWPYESTFHIFLEKQPSCSFTPRRKKTIQAVITIRSKSQRLLRCGGVNGGKSSAKLNQLVLDAKIDQGLDCPRFSQCVKVIWLRCFQNKLQFDLKTWYSVLLSWT